MFRHLGQWATKYRVSIIITWVALAVTLPVIAPSLDEVGTSDQRDFLTDDAPFAEAERLYQEVFPEDFSPSSGLIVIDSGDPGGIAETTPTWSYMASLTTWLMSEDSPNNIIDVSSPSLDPRLAAQLVSEDGRYAFVAFALSTPDQESLDTVDAIDEWLDDHTPSDIEVYHTGQAKINAEGDEVQLESLDRTLIITVALVIVFLLVIYRSPVSPLIPLFAVTMAFLVTVGLLGVLGDAGVLTVISQMNAFVIIVMYGAGTDYCLFLINRFREEMAATHDITVATQETVHRVGETISSSAATVFVGFMGMAFAELKAFANTGPMLAVGIVVGLLAGLTLTPALLSLLGERAFWPNKARHRSHGKWYDFTSRLVSSHPLVTIVVIVAIMVPFGVYGLTRDLNYEVISDYPDDMESIQGYNLLEANFGSGLLYPMTVVAANRSPETLAAEIAGLNAELAAVDGVTDIMSLNNPLGMHSDQFQNLLRLDTQLQMALGMVSQTLESGDPQQIESVISGTKDYLRRVTEHFPVLADDPKLAQLQILLDSGPETIAADPDGMVATVTGLSERLAGLDDPYLMLDQAGPLFDAFAPIASSYLSQDGRAYRMTINLANEPGADESFKAVEEIRDVLTRYGGEHEIGISGTAAVFTDIKETLDRDFVRAFGIVLAGIFIVLLLMLRSVVAPLYLIGTVLLSYAFTLGVANIVFDVFFDTPRLSFFVPFLMFVFLVALGIDYSIFLFGRIKEEVGYHGVREGVHVAVATTGAIITAAGLILAGTFAGLMAGEIKFLAQVGFAVALGVLVDTFIVRTILDPALAALFGRWTWWPGGVPKAQRGRGTMPAPGSGD